MSTSSHPLLDAFEARLGRLGHKPGTIRKYRAGAAHFLDWLDSDPASARRSDIERYLDSWAAASAASAGTIRLRIAALKKLYDFLDSRGDLVDGAGRELRSPVERVERPRSRKRAGDWLDSAEDAAVLSAPINAQERIVIAILRWTGLRIGEACSLVWRDVDLERGALRVRASKSDSGIRTVPLLPELVAEVQSWRRYIEARGLYEPAGPVLVTARRTAMKPQFAWRLVKRVAARAGVRSREATDASGWNVSELTPHTFRRTLATDLLNRGVRLETVAKLLGHADTRVTQAYYAELLDQTARDEILEAMAS